MNAVPKKQPAPEDKGIVIGIYFDPAVLRAIDKYAEAQERSRSWMVNKILKEKVGVIDDED